PEPIRDLRQVVGGGTEGGSRGGMLPEFAQKSTQTSVRVGSLPGVGKCRVRPVRTNRRGRIAEFLLRSPEQEQTLSGGGPGQPRPISEHAADLTPTSPCRRGPRGCEIHGGSRRTAKIDMRVKCVPRRVRTTLVEIALRL